MKLLNRKLVLSVLSCLLAVLVVVQGVTDLWDQTECRAQQANCTDSVYPYLNDPSYMFPTTLQHVNQMCKMWSTFVDCIRRYIANCFEESRRTLFHKSVENSIDTVHAICSSKNYQNEYLAKANCFKQISMDHCGQNYRQLIDNIENPYSTDEHICCSYAHFKKCVSRPLLEECGRKAKNLMDHSMSFLITRCDHQSYLRTEECTKPVPYSKNLDVEQQILLKPVADEEPSQVISNQMGVAKAENSGYDEVKPVEAESREWPEATSTDATLQPNLILTATTTTTAPKKDLANQEDSKSANRIDQSESELIIYTMKPPAEMEPQPMSQHYHYDSAANRITTVVPIATIFCQLVMFVIFTHL